MFAERDPVHARFSDRVDAVADGIVMVDRNGRTVLSNRQAAQLSGHARGDLEGPPVERLLPAASGAAHARRGQCDLAHLPEAAR